VAHAPHRPSGTPESLLRGRRIPLAKRISDLVDGMHRCVESSQPLNFSAAAHREITEALRIVVYEPPLPSQPSPPQLKVVYEDGSRPVERPRDGRPSPLLPVRCLAEVSRPPIDTMPSLNVGTLSFRHLDYDKSIDLYLIRDRETRSLSNGEIHDLAYMRMRELVSDSTLRSRDARIVIFQTGLEPLIVGLYCAVIEELITRRARSLPTLVVQPTFFADGDRDAEGAAWS